MATLKKKGHQTSPVAIEGRKIATTFWGEAWCENLERYSDFANRLPRGRTYVRNGSVIDLQIAPGTVTALVSGSDTYEIAMKIGPVPQARWRAICRDCSGAIDSVVELLQGRLSKHVMTRICEEKTGCFPHRREITFDCSCPDWASMCKHVAAVLYGIGARLDEQPDLLFLLRNVNHHDLIASAGRGLRAAAPRPSAGKILNTSDVSEIFGIDIGEPEPLGRGGADPVAVPAKSKAWPKPRKQAAAEARSRAARGGWPPRTARGWQRSRKHVGRRRRKRRENGESAVPMRFPLLPERREP